MNKSHLMPLKNVIQPKFKWRRHREEYSSLEGLIAGRQGWAGRGSRAEHRQGCGERGILHLTKTSGTLGTLILMQSAVISNLLQAHRLWVFTQFFLKITKLSLHCKQTKKQNYNPKVEPFDLWQLLPPPAPTQHVLATSFKGRMGWEVAR